MQTPEITIDKTRPIPATRRQCKYPFGEMTVGDSFFSGCKTVSSAAYVWASKRPGVKFSARTEGDGKRVWRIA